MEEAATLDHRLGMPKHLRDLMTATSVHARSAATILKRVVTILLVVGAAATWSGVGSAGDDAKARAKEAYSRAEALSAQSKWAEAAQSFAEADALVANDTALESALEASLRADLPTLAMTLVERAGRSPASAAFPSVATARQRFTPRASLVVIPCVAQPTPCVARLDGRPVLAVRTWLEPGRHEVAFEGAAAGSPSSIDLLPGVTTELAAPAPVPIPDSPPPPPRVARAPAPTVEADPGTSPWWLTLPGGLTLAFGGALIGTALQTQSVEAELAEYQVGALPPEGAPDAAHDAFESRQRELIDEGETMSVVTNVFIGLTGAAGAATVLVAIFAVDWGGDSPPPPVGLVVPNGRGGVDVVVFGTF